MDTKEEKKLHLEEWKDCEKLFKHVGADISRKNNRLRISINGRFAIFHCLDIHDQIDLNSLNALKKFLKYAGDHEI